MIVRVDENMSCAKECLKVNSSACITENQAYKKDDHEVRLALPGSSRGTVTEESTDKHSTVDRSAFNSKRKPTKYIDALPKSNYSPSKKTSTTGKQRSSSTSELRHKDHQPSPKKALVQPTDDKCKKLSSSSKSKLKDQTALSTMDKQKVTQHDETAKSAVLPPSLTVLQKSKQANCSNYRTEFNPELTKNTSQMTIQTMNKSSSEASSSVSHRNISVSSIPSNTVYPRVNARTQSSSRHAEISSVSTLYDSNDNRTDKWGGQRKRTSHFANMPIEQQVRRKRHHSDDTGSKKAKLN